MKYENVSFITNMLFYKLINTTTLQVFNPDGLYLNVNVKQKGKLIDAELFNENCISSLKEEKVRINALNIHFRQPMFKFRLSGQHLGLTRSFQIMVCSVLNQFPWRDLRITFPQVFSIKDVSSSLPTSPTSAHKKMNNGTHMC